MKKLDNSISICGISTDSRHTVNETVKKTLIVIGFVVLFAILIAALDLLFNVSIVRWFTK